MANNTLWSILNAVLVSPRSTKSLLNQRLKHNILPVLVTISSRRHRQYLAKEQRDNAQNLTARRNFNCILLALNALPKRIEGNFLNVHDQAIKALPYANSPLHLRPYWLSEWMSREQIICVAGGLGGDDFKKLLRVPR